MNYTLSILPDHKIVRITAKGKYSIGDIKRLIEIVTRDKDYRPDYNSLIDIREVRYTPVVSEIMDFSSFIGTVKESFKAKVALLVRGEVLYNLFTLSSRLSRQKGINVYIFNDHEKAEEWIRSSS